MSVWGKIGFVVIVFILAIGLFSVFSKNQAHKIPSGDSLEPPGFSHPLGTDDLGIDLWAQICHGAGISMLVGFGSAFLAGVGGSLLGILSGYYGKWIDKLVMGICNIMMVIPHFPMMIVFATFFGPGLKNIILVIALLSWTRPARTVRSKILSLKHENYIRAARGYGAGFWHLAIRHFIPSVAPIMMVSIIHIVRHAIVAESGLAFLGLGDPLSKSWGIILNRSINFPGIYFTDYWKWWVMSPLFFLTLLVVSVASLGRDIERLVDHKTGRG